MITLDELLRGWRPGSYDSSWTWIDENEAIDAHPQTAELLASIEAEGMQEPISLGDDGRVWDGHHRVCIAARLGFDVVPVVLCKADGQACSSCGAGFVACRYLAARGMSGCCGACAVGDTHEGGPAEAGPLERRRDAPLTGEATADDV